MKMKRRRARGRVRRGKNPRQGESLDKDKDKTDSTTTSKQDPQDTPAGRRILISLAYTNRFSPVCWFGLAPLTCWNDSYHSSPEYVRTKLKHQPMLMGQQLYEPIVLEHEDPSTTGKKKTGGLGDMTHPISSDPCHAQVPRLVKDTYGHNVIRAVPWA